MELPMCQRPMENEFGYLVLFLTMFFFIKVKGKIKHFSISKTRRNNSHIWLNVDLFLLFVEI